MMIYNNDISTSLVSESLSSTSNKKPCQVTYTGGGSDTQREAAYRKSMLEVMKELENIYFKRVVSSKQERMEYWLQVQRNIAANRRANLFGSLGSAFQVIAGGASILGSSFGNIISTGLGYLRSGFGGLFSRGMADQMNFYWHTDRQNIRHIDRLKFSRIISDDGNSWVNLDIAPHICLAYRPQMQRYVPCTDQEASLAVKPIEASQIARESCVPSDSTGDCMQDRLESAPRDPDTGNVTLPDWRIPTRVLDDLTDEM